MGVSGALGKNHLGDTDLVRQDRREADIVVVAEHHERAIATVTYEVVAFASRLARSMGGAIKVALVASPARPLAEEIARVTGHDVLAFESQEVPFYDAHLYRSVLARLCRALAPRFVVVPHTPTGLDFAPSLAVDTGASCITGVTRFTCHQEGPAFTREICNGKLSEEVRGLPGRPCIVTVMPGAENGALRVEPEAGTIRIEAVDIAPGRARTLGYIEPPIATSELRDAEVIVAGGRGIKGPEWVGALRELAGLFRRGVVACSRPLCDMGWLPFECQVGMTGQSVSPKLYIACGISGAVHHIMGMKKSELIVAITLDRNAPLCSLAHYCVIADLRLFLPALIEHLKGTGRQGGAGGPEIHTEAGAGDGQGPKQYA